MKRLLLGITLVLIGSVSACERSQEPSVEDIPGDVLQDALGQSGNEALSEMLRQYDSTDNYSVEVLMETTDGDGSSHAVEMSFEKDGKWLWYGVDDGNPIDIFVINDNDTAQAYMNPEIGWRSIESVPSVDKNTGFNPLDANPSWFESDDDSCFHLKEEYKESLLMAWNASVFDNYDHATIESGTLCIDGDDLHGEFTVNDQDSLVEITYRFYNEGAVDLEESVPE